MTKTIEFKFPTNTQRVSIMGRTGSGKTQFGAWILSEAPYTSMPYVCINYKHDDLIDDIPYIQEIDLKRAPTKPGIYVVHPRPGMDDDAVEDFLGNIWARGRTGVVFDEAYMIPKTSNYFDAILTQGRSKRIPAICLTQRPSRISRFVFTEADYYAVFHLNDRQDQKRVQEFLPRSANIVGEEKLPDFQCLWYDVKQDVLFTMLPVPDRDAILDRFDQRLAPRRRYI